MVRLSGEGGQLTQGGRVLARIGTWEMSREGRCAEIIAEVAQYDRYLLPRGTKGQLILQFNTAQLHYAVTYTLNGEQLEMQGEHTYG